MDTSGIPGLCLVSENLTRIEDNISILCSPQAGGLLTDPPSVKAVPANLGQPGAGHLPGPTRSTGRQREKGSENKKNYWPRAKLEQQQMLSWVSWELLCSVPCLGTGLPPASFAHPDHVQTGLVRVSWPQGAEMLFEHEMRLQQKALNSSFCLESFSGFQLPLASHSAQQLWLHIVHSGCLTKLD